MTRPAGSHALTTVHHPGLWRARAVMWAVREITTKKLPPSKSSDGGAWRTRRRCARLGLLVTSEIAVASLVPNEQLVKCVFDSFYAVQCEQSGLQLATMRNPAANAGCSLPKPSRRGAAHYHGFAQKSDVSGSAA